MSLGPLAHLLAAVLALGTSTTSDAQKGSQVNDLVVMGKVENGLTYEVLDEFGMNVRITARFTISRVVTGRLTPPVIKIRYIAHGDMPTDREVELRLRRSDDGIYLVCSEGGGRGYICD
ncbi:MAG TPA: hypothetical protein VGN68_05560 [Sphingopyxis sp.]|jgi:hypothetical protein|uniref:hypothetical protein n=1 Tax=Sphingopyxis sp. TaxID=1908224 RepID=UPI002E14EC64|nr:hypothetical protein [Sphingopyxis sp.]